MYFTHHTEASIVYKVNKYAKLIADITDKLNKLISEKELDVLDVYKAFINASIDIVKKLQQESKKKVFVELDTNIDNRYYESLRLRTRIENNGTTNLKLVNRIENSEILDSDFEQQYKEFIRRNDKFHDLFSIFTFKVFVSGKTTRLVLKLIWLGYLKKVEFF